MFMSCINVWMVLLVEKEVVVFFIFVYVIDFIDCAIFFVHREGNCYPGFKFDQKWDYIFDTQSKDYMWHYNGNKSAMMK